MYTLLSYDDAALARENSSDPVVDMSPRGETATRTGNKIAPSMHVDAHGIEPVAGMELFDLLANGFTPVDFASRPIDDEYLLLAFWGLQDLSLREFHTMLWNACYHDGASEPDQRVLNALYKPFLELAAAACLLGYCKDGAVYLDDELHVRCLDVINDTNCIEAKMYEATRMFPMPVSYKPLFGTIERDVLVSKIFQDIRCNVSGIAQALLDSTYADVRGMIDVVGNGGYLIHEDAYDVFKGYIENEMPYLMRLVNRGVHAFVYDVRNDRLCPEIVLGDDDALASFLEANSCAVMTHEGGETESPLDVAREIYDSGLIADNKYLVILSHNKTSVAYRRIRELRDALSFTILTSCSEYELNEGYDPFGAENVDVLQLVKQESDDNGRAGFCFLLSDEFSESDTE